VISKNGLLELLETLVIVVQAEKTSTDELLVKTARVLRVTLVVVLEIMSDELLTAEDPELIVLFVVPFDTTTNVELLAAKITVLSVVLAEFEELLDIIRPAL
jgi:hypothetical protein